ncbi:helix-turn-helix domain-containing protein [Allorhizocola rhizosphaerae]|uniref:helix-turn-helix domain-containing protein n=1 Tax=Allorhizocola rhizosphaerae TaxID=1872709 RepID=UPI000E3BDE39|nr:helix-turn-helix domain-containing protein [Allorhizocola rhizosphaerae]
MDATAKLNPTLLRGLAHPLRVRMLGLLREFGPANATMLAQRLGQSTGMTSYHLRQLAQYGFVVEDPDSPRDARERWWKAAHRTTILDSDAIEEAPGESEAYMRAVAAQYAERVDRWLNERASLPPQWHGAATLSDFRLRLTPEEGRRLHDELFALAARYRRDDESEPGDGDKVVLQFQIMPFPQP